MPACWIPPARALEARAVVRLCKDLLDGRGAWQQRVAAAVFHQGAPGTASLSAGGRATGMGLPAAGQQAVETGQRQTGRLDAELGLPRRQPGCAALRAAHLGTGAVISAAIWAELGDVRRSASSGAVARRAGLDITVCSCDTNRSAGHLPRRGPPLPRWALYEAAVCAARPAAPGHGYHTAARAGRDAGRATLPAARQLARRCHHTLRGRGEDAAAPAA